MMKYNEFNHYFSRDTGIRKLQTDVDNNIIDEKEMQLIIQCLDERASLQKFSESRWLMYATALSRSIRASLLTKPYYELTYPEFVSLIGRIKLSDYKDTTKCDYITILMVFMRYLVKQNIIPGGNDVLQEMSAIKVPTRKQSKISQNDIFTKEEILKLISVGAQSIKDKAMFGIWYECALRPSEVAELKWKDITPQNGGAMVHIRTVKTDYPRTIWIEEFYEYLYQWLNTTKRNNPSDYVFYPNEKSTHYENHTLNYRFYSCRDRAGIKKLNKYNIRHTRAMHLIAEGMNELYVKMILEGHEDTTAIRAYITPDENMLKHAIQIHNGTIQPTQNESPLTPIVCPACRFVNPPDSEYCRHCATPLTEKAKDNVNNLMVWINNKQQSQVPSSVIEMSDEDLMRELQKRFGAKNNKR